MRQALAALTALLLLTSCQAEPTPRTGEPSSNVDVDTPELRAQKQRAGVEDCVRGASSNDLPDVTLGCLGGGVDVELGKLQGPLVVNLFAQWCAPCRKEMPYYQELHEKAGDRVDVLGIDYLDTQPAAALDLAEQTGVTYPLAADPAGALRDDFKIRGLPGIVLVDADGQVAAVQFRAFRSYDELRQVVEEELGLTLPR